MSGKRQALILALALSVGLMGATKPRYGAWRVAGVGQYGAPVGQQAVTKIFTVGQTNSSFASWSASATKVDCSATWAWDEVASNWLTAVGVDSIAQPGDGNICYDDYERSGYGDCSQSRGSAGWRNFAQNGAISNKLTLLYLPFEASIPAGSTILSAVLVISREYAQAMGGGAGMDSLWAVLDTLSGDAHWLAGPNTGNNSVKFAGKRAASWVNQVQSVIAADSAYVNRRAGYPEAATAHAWSPSLSARRRPIDWGVRGLGYVVPSGFSNDADASAGYVIDATRPVQYAVSGAANNGFVLMYSSSCATHTGYLRVSPNPADANYRPFLKVTYSPAAYNGGPWAGKEVGFCFTTDDGLRDANAAYAAAFSARGLSYTAFVTQKTIELGDANSASYAELLQYWRNGIEIGSHGRQHPAQVGLLRYSDNSILTSGSAIDSLSWCMSPAWIDSGLAAVSPSDDATVESLAASLTCGKTIAAPQGFFTLSILAKAYDLGYYGFRSAGGYGAASSSLRPTPGDTLGVMIGDCGAGNYWLRNVGMTTPRRQNNFAFRIGPELYNGTLWHDGIDQLTVSGGSPTNDEAKFKRAVRGLIDQAAAQHNEYMVWLSHALASNPGVYAGLIDSVQVEWMLDAIEEAGNVAVMNFSTLSRTFRGGMIAVDHPAWGDLSWREVIRAAGPYPLWGEKSEFYTPAAAPAANDTQYAIVGTSPLTPRVVSVGNRAHLWTATPTTVDSTGIAWAILDYKESGTGSQAKRDSSGYTPWLLSDFTINGDPAIPANESPNNTACLLRLPYSLPTGRQIAKATLCLYVEPGSPIVLSADLTSDVFYVIGDTTTTNHSLWYTTTGQSRWDHDPDTEPMWPHRANASWSYIVGGPNGSATAWSPTLSSLATPADIGPYVSITASGSYGGYVGIDVTSLLADHRTRSLRFLYYEEDNIDYVRISQPDAAIRAKRPFLIVKTIPTP